MVNSAGSTEFGIGTDGLSATFCTKGETLEYDLIAGDDMSAIFGSYVQLTGMSNPVSENCVAGAPVILDSSSRTTADSVLNVVSKAKDAGLHISEVWLGNILASADRSVRI